MEPLTRAENAGAVLGILFGAFVIWISVDLLSGGALTRMVSRAAPAEEDSGDDPG